MVKYRHRTVPTMAHAISTTLREHGSYDAKLVQYDGQVYYGTIVGLKGGYGEPQDNLVFVTVKDIRGASPPMDGVIGMDVGTWQLKIVEMLSDAEWGPKEPDGLR